MAWYLYPASVRHAPPPECPDGGFFVPAGPVGNHLDSAIPYPANLLAPGGGLIFFCALFLYQDKKRVWGTGGKAPYDNDSRLSGAPKIKYYADSFRSVAPAGLSDGDSFP